MDKIHIVIPARFKSRLSGKPLKKILGKEMLVRVAIFVQKFYPKNK